jgi:hypothetical protein
LWAIILKKGFFAHQPALAFAMLKPIFLFSALLLASGCGDKTPPIEEPIRYVGQASALLNGELWEVDVHAGNLGNDIFQIEPVKKDQYGDIIERITFYRIPFLEQKNHLPQSDFSTPPFSPSAFYNTILQGGM